MVVYYQIAGKKVGSHVVCGHTLVVSLASGLAFLSFLHIHCNVVTIDLVPC